jgi:hypothetical protein
MPPDAGREVTRGKKRNGENEKGTRGPFFSGLHEEDLHEAEIGAGNETRTRDPDLGKVVLYQLSYSRMYNIKLASPRGLEPLLPP